MRKYWTKQDYEDIKNAKRYEDLTKAALRILKRMPRPVAQVCGPISTGGKGSIKSNLKVLAETIKHLRSKSVSVFEQLPFETHMERVGREKVYTKETELLEAFYLPMFEKRLISTLYFIPDWQSSFGARWEYRQAKKLKLKIIFL